MSNAIRMSRDSVAAVICPEAMARVRELFHSEMTFGVHHVWENGAVLFTAEGLTLLCERLRESFPGDALALQAELSTRVAALTPSEEVALAGAARPERLAGDRRRHVSSRFGDSDL